MLTLRTVLRATSIVSPRETVHPNYDLNQTRPITLDRDKWAVIVVIGVSGNLAGALPAQGCTNVPLNAPLWDKSSRTPVSCTRGIRNSVGRREQRVLPILSPFFASMNHWSRSVHDRDFSDESNTAETARPGVQFRRGGCRSLAQPWPRKPAPAESATNHRKGKERGPRTRGH